MFLQFLISNMCANSYLKNLFTIQQFTQTAFKELSKNTNLSNFLNIDRSGPSGFTVLRREANEGGKTRGPDPGETRTGTGSPAPEAAQLRRSPRRYSEWVDFFDDILYLWRDRN